MTAPVVKVKNVKKAGLEVGVDVTIQMTRLLCQAFIKYTGGLIHSCL